MYRVRSIREIATLSRSGMNAVLDEFVHLNGALLRQSMIIWYGKPATYKDADLGLILMDGVDRMSLVAHGWGMLTIHVERGGVIWRHVELLANSRCHQWLKEEGRYVVPHQVN